MKYVFSQQEVGELVLAELSRRGVSGAVRSLVWNVARNHATGAWTLEVAVEVDSSTVEDGDTEWGENGV